jgi:signal peptidase I
VTALRSVATACRRLAILAAFGLIAGLWAVTLRPVSLGGPATFLVVRGDSMLPTYETGDLLVLHTAASYAVGDAVGYRVPDGELGAGQVVVHRIVAVRDGGTYVMEGDNNPSPDPWTPATTDIAGEVWAAIPLAGRAVVWLHQPATLAALAAAIAVVIVLGGGGGPAEDRRVRGPDAPAARATP